MTSRLRPPRRRRGKRRPTIEPMATSVSQGTSVDLSTLAAIERRVLWLAVRIVDYANRERPSGDALKVGGHQASSASMVTLMTALWLADLDARDRVSVKPHASPVMHALEYLLGRLDRSYLTRLRDFGGLQSYPTRTKDAFPVDYSTGSVGPRARRPAPRRARRPLRRDALRGVDRWPLHLAPRRRRARRGQPLGGGGRAAHARARQRALDRRPQPAVARPRDPRDPSRRARGALPDERLGRDRAQVRPSSPRRVRRGRRRAAAPADRRDAERGLSGALRRLRGRRARARCSSRSSGDRARVARAAARRRRRRRRASSAISAATTSATSSTRCAGRARRRDRPSVVFAYTIKGYGLEIAGRPQNHSALLTGEQIESFRLEVGLTPETEWDGFAPGSPEGELLEAARERLDRGERPRAARRSPVPASLTDRDPPRRSPPRRRSAASCSSSRASRASASGS